MAQKVLILCTKNSCRSQMAEGVLKHYGGDKFIVESAGLEPTRVNKNAIKVMKEIGIDISKQKSKNVTKFLGDYFGYIITVCADADKRCPIFPGVSQRLYWPFNDPPQTEDDSPEILEEFREVRDQIHSRFKEAAEKGFGPFVAKTAVEKSGAKK
jgi:arsenate reductase (thioredoxin)